MTSYTSVESLMVDSIIMIALDKEEREKTHLIHRWIAEKKGLDWEEMDLSDVVRMIYIRGMMEYPVETERERTERLEWMELRRKEDGFNEMTDRSVKFHDDRFVAALMKEGEE